MQNKTSDTSQTESIQTTARLYESFAEIFLNEPSEKIVEKMSILGHLFGSPINKDLLDIDALKQCYFDRFIVASSPLYIPSTEQCIRGMQRTGASLIWGSLSGKYSQHVSACYQAVGFHYKNLIGYDPSIKRLQPDSLATELAFVAFLRTAEAENHDELGGHYEKLAQQFVIEHLVTWVPMLRDSMLSKASDTYTHIMELLADFIEEEVRSWT